MEERRYDSDGRIRAPPVRPNGPIKIQWRSRVDRGEIHKLFVGLDELEVLRIVDEEEGDGVYRGRTTEIWGFIGIL